MESFVHLRKGKTPKRLHADLDGLKDDELGRGGFTGRTANMYRRNDPTAYRSVGPLRPIDVLSSELKPSDATDAARRSAADVLQRRLPGAAVPAHRADAVLRPVRRRRPALLRARGIRACWRPSSGRCATARATGSTSRRRAPGGRSPTTSRTLADDPGHRRVPRAPAGPAGQALPVRPVAGRDSRPGADRRRRRSARRRRVRGPADPRGWPDNAFSTNTIHSTSRAGGATTSRSPSTSTTTTSSPPTACTYRRPCTCSCRRPGST